MNDAMDILMKDAAILLMKGIAQQWLDYYAAQPRGDVLSDPPRGLNERTIIDLCDDLLEAHREIARLQGEVGRTSQP